MKKILLVTLSIAAISNLAYGRGKASTIIGTCTKDEAKDAQTCKDFCKAKNKEYVKYGCYGPYNTELDCACKQPSEF